jgi:mRNA interferase RelE/StbE
VSLPTYRVELEKPAQKAMARLPADLRWRLTKAFERLAENPRPQGYIQLKGQEDNYFRIRIGDWRIIYTIYDDKLLIIVVDVGPRADIYRKY